MRSQRKDTWTRYDSGESNGHYVDGYGTGDPLEWTETLPTRRRRHRWVWVAGLSLVVAGLFTGLAFALGGGVPVVQAVPLPADAEHVAAQIGATGCHQDQDPSAVYWLTACSAVYRGQKVGINTFASKTGRDAWLAISGTYGVTPILESATWVVYPSLAATA
jgi:hypothetical protein